MGRGRGAFVGLSGKEDWHEEGQKEKGKLENKKRIGN